VVTAAVAAVGAAAAVAAMVADADATAKSNFSTPKPPFSFESGGSAY